MVPSVSDPVDTTDICVVESGGVAVALRDADVVCLLPRVAGPTVAGVPTMVVEGRPRALVSLREALCLDGGADEEIVVMLGIGDQLLGLTVERIHAREEAAVLPTLHPTYAMAMFAQLVQAGEAGVLSVLNPARLALCVGETTPSYRAAA
jgi:hypothetical protein